MFSVLNLRKSINEWLNNKVSTLFKEKELEYKSILDIAAYEYGNKCIKSAVMKMKILNFSLVRKYKRVLLFKL